jgi:hypothetical protein
MMYLVHHRGETDTRIRGQAAAVRELASTLRRTAPEPILVKGFAQYALTGEPCHRFLSEDVDLLCSETEEFLRTLASLEYSGERFDEESHEFVWGARAGVVIEGHRHISFWTYPDGAMAADLVPLAEPKRWLQSYSDPAEFRLTYSDISSHSVRSSIPAVEGVLVADASASAAILCAHEFRHAIQMFRNFGRTSFRQLYLLRLGPLADIRDLVLSPSFCAEAFYALIGRGEGHDAVRYVARLMELFLGEAFVPPPPFEPWEMAARPFPRLLAELGCYAALSTADDVRLLASNTADTQLGAVTVAPRLAGQLPSWMAVNQPEGGDETARAASTAVLRRTRERDLPLVPFRFWVQEEMAPSGAPVMVATVHMPSGLAKGSYHLCFFRLSDSGRRSASADPSGVRLRYDGEHWHCENTVGSTVCVSEKDFGCEVTLAIPVEPATRYLRYGYHILVASWGDTSHDAMLPDTATLVPLRIRSVPSDMRASP